MYLTIKQQIKHLSKQEYKILKHLCHIAKNLTNEAIYAVKQHYKTTHTYLGYNRLYQHLKMSPNYKTLNSNMAQQILKRVDAMFQSYFALLKKAHAGEYDTKKCHVPYYLPKDGYTGLIIAMVRITDEVLVLPYSNSYKKDHEPIKMKVPPVLTGKRIVHIKIVPRSNARFFEIQYTYEADCSPKKFNINHALGLDPGVNNLLTGVTNHGQSFIIDGRRLKSINQWYNKEHARLQSVKDKQGYSKYDSHRQARLTQKRNRRVNDYISKTAKMVINYCIVHDIGTLVIGYNKNIQNGVNLGCITNQNFVNIPHGRLVDKLQYLSELNGIHCIVQEESYTSKASFWDKDDIPTYDPKKHGCYKFSGQRIYRGLYKLSDGYTFNADVNGALNILRKSNAVDLSVLSSRGDVDTPIRIRVA